MRDKIENKFRLSVCFHHRSHPQIKAKGTLTISHIPIASKINSYMNASNGISFAQAAVNWLKISGRSTNKGVPLTSRRAASIHSVAEHIRPERVLGSMIQTVSTPIAR